MGSAGQGQSQVLSVSMGFLLHYVEMQIPKQDVNRGLSLCINPGWLFVESL